VRKVLVKLGDSVTEGQPVVIIESTDAHAALAAYRQASARLRQAESALAKCERDLLRLRDLYEHRAVALKDVNNAETEMIQAQASVQALQAEVEEARQRLSLLGLSTNGETPWLEVRAPISGKVMEINVAPGEFRSDITVSLMTIVDLSTVWGTSNVPEGSIRLIQTGEPVEIRLIAFPDRIFRGRVTRIADTVDAETRTVKVQAELANPTGSLKPGMFGTIFHSHGKVRRPSVPASAVVHEDSNAYVFVEARPGVYEKVRIQAEPEANGWVPVRSGLQGGERVVVSGAPLLAAR